jgi:hypothetical protein
MGHLDVVVPPDIINEDTSGDVMVPEGGTVKLTCRARGYPVPHVLWRREDNIDLVIKEPTGVKTKGEFKMCRVYRYIFKANYRIFISYNKIILFIVQFCIFVLLCIFCFHRANWHSSAILTEVFRAFFLSCKVNARV